MKIKIDYLFMTACSAVLLTGCLSPNSDVKKSDMKTDRVHTSPVIVGQHQQAVTNIVSSSNGTVTNVSWQTIPIVQDMPDGRVSTEECSAEQKSFVRRWFPWLCSNRAFNCPNEQQKCSAVPAFSGGSWMPATAYPGYDMGCSGVSQDCGYGARIIIGPSYGGGYDGGCHSSAEQVYRAIGNGSSGPYGYGRR